MRAHPSRRSDWRRPASLALAAAALAVPAASATAAPFAYVANYVSDDVTVIDLATGVPRPATIPVGNQPASLAITPDGATAYVTNFADDSLTPIDIATNTAGAPIPVGDAPAGVAVTPNGNTAFVANRDSGDVTPIDVATNTPGAPIGGGNGPFRIAITPNGATAYVTNLLGDDVTTIDIATNTAGAPIPLAAGTVPQGIAVTPNGSTAYVTGGLSADLTPIDTGTNTAGTPIPVGAAPQSVAVTPNGATAYVVNGATDDVTPIEVPTGAPGAPIPVGTQPRWVAIAPDGSTAYVANGASDDVTPIDTSTNTAGTPIPAGDTPSAIAITPPPPAPPPPDPPAPPPPPGLPGAPTSGNPVCNPVPERDKSRKGTIRYTRSALKIQQNIDSAVIRRLNAANVWMDQGIVPSDLCFGAFGPGAFQAGISWAGGAAHDPSPPSPRQIEIIKRPGIGTITRSLRQLQINENISRALRARAIATVKRIEALTGGNLAPGAILSGRALYPGLQVVGQKPPSADAPAAELEIGSLPRKIPIRPNASTVKKQQQRSQGSIILANRALDAITGGLTEENFQTGSIGSGRV